MFLYVQESQFFSTYYLATSTGPLLKHAWVTKVVKHSPCLPSAASRTMPLSSPPLCLPHLERVAGAVTISPSLTRDFVSLRPSRTMTQYRSRSGSWHTLFDQYPFCCHVSALWQKALALLRMFSHHCSRQCCGSFLPFCCKCSFDIPDFPFVAICRCSLQASTVAVPQALIALGPHFARRCLVLTR